MSSVSEKRWRRDGYTSCGSPLPRFFFFRTRSPNEVRWSNCKYTYPGTYLSSLVSQAQVGPGNEASTYPDNIYVLRNTTLYQLLGTSTVTHA